MTCTNLIYTKQFLSETFCKLGTYQKYVLYKSALFKRGIEEKKKIKDKSVSIILKNYKLKLIFKNNLILNVNSGINVDSKKHPTPR